MLPLLTVMVLLSSPVNLLADEGFKPGVIAADFTLPDMAGKQVALSQYKGKVVLLNFWAMWCRPCRAEMPSMEKLYSAYKDKDFVILAVSMDHKEKGEVVEFIKKNGYTFPVLLDPDGALSENYKVPYIPATFVIDRQGQIVFREYGARKWDSAAARGKIDELLSKK
ncbi:MAG: TlpA family protein disulfide reductase [Nitrospirota bacterium]|nr:TlpA family protein disulfide reductase [Nitrospirota bacterium]